MKYDSLFKWKKLLLLQEMQEVAPAVVEGKSNRFSTCQRASLQQARTAALEISLVHLSAACSNMKKDHAQDLF